MCWLRGKAQSQPERLTRWYVACPQFAIKILSKDNFRGVTDIERVYSETFILKTLRHPNIIKLHEVFDADTGIMLVMEYADGGELSTYVKEKGRLSEEVRWGEWVYSFVVLAGF